MTQVFAQAALIVSRHTCCLPTGCVTVALRLAVNTGDWFCGHGLSVPDTNLDDNRSIQVFYFLCKCACLHK